jgi:iron(III) transport system ATP-binding protein
VSRLQVSGLWKDYGAQPVLTGVDLDVPDGSLTAVLGLSGCGKTTMLRVLAGFERADRGTVTLGPTTLDDESTYVAPERRGVGYVPQEGALFPNLTVEANVGFGLSRAERRAGAAGEFLVLVGLAKLAKRYPHQLSGGEQQRVALARALARRPDILLLDEPFSSLDAALRATVRLEVQTLLREQQITTVMVTHDQEEALSMADRVAVLRDGRVVQEGTPAQLYTQPVDASLAHFLGAANVVRARIDAGGAHTALGVLSLHGEAGAGGHDDASVMLRPEQLEVHTDPRPGLAGSVERCDYYGHDAVMHIRPDAPGEADVLLARVGGEHALAVGTAVFVTARGFAARVDRVHRTID